MSAPIADRPSATVTDHTDLVESVNIAQLRTTVNNSPDPGDPLFSLSSGSQLSLPEGPAGTLQNL